MDQRILVQFLAFAGALPFVACALLPLFGTASIAPLGPLDAVAGSYGLGILSFIAGTHWAFQLLRRGDTPFDLFISSNVTFLLVWISWLIAPLNWALAIQALCFVSLLHIDRELSLRGVTSGHYFRIRSLATGAASLSLLIIVFTP